MSESISGIYGIVNRLNGDKYIGSAYNVIRRWSQHRYYLNKGNHRNKYLQAAWIKYGNEQFCFVVLELCDRGRLLEREQFFVDQLNPKYNICRIVGKPLKGNKYCLGRKHTQESKDKMSAALKKNTSTTWRIRTPETRKKMSLAKKGNQCALGTKQTEETKRKRSLALKGKKSSLGRRATQETKNKMSKSQKLRWINHPEARDEVSRRMQLRWAKYRALKGAGLEK